MTEYNDDPEAIAEFQASLARTHEWVVTTPPGDAAGIFEDKPHSVWEGYQPSEYAERASRRSVPPNMEERYAEQEEKMRGQLNHSHGAGSDEDDGLKYELDHNLPGAPIPVPPPPEQRAEASRSGSVKSHRTNRTTTTAAARAAPLPPSLPSSGSRSRSGGQRSAQSHPSQHSAEHSRPRTRSLAHTDNHFIDVEPAALPVLQSNSHAYPFNPTPQPMSTHSVSTQPEQIMIRPPASHRSHSNASNNSNSYSLTHSVQHSPTNPHSPNSAGHFPSTYSRGTVAAGVPLPPASTRSASLSYAATNHAVSQHGPQATPYPMQHNELPSLPASAYGHGAASVTPSQSPSNQMSPDVRSRGFDVGDGQGTPRASSRAQTLHHDRAPSSHRSAPLSPRKASSRGGGGSLKEAYVLVESPVLPAPAPAASSRRSVTSSQGQGHVYSRSYPPPSAVSGPSHHTHSVHDPPSVKERYSERGIPPPSHASQHSYRSRSGDSRRESGRLVDREANGGGSRRSGSRGSGKHPPSIVYAPARHSRDTHFVPPAILDKTSAQEYMNGLGMNAVAPPPAQAQGPVSPMRASMQQQMHMDAPIQVPQQHQPASRQASVHSIRRAHTVSHHSGYPASVAVSVRPPSQRSPPRSSSSRTRGQAMPQAVIPGSMGSPGMVASTSAPLPAMGQENGGGTMVIPRGISEVRPASAGGAGGSVHGGSMHGHESAKGVDSWGRASQMSKRSKGSRKEHRSNVSAASLPLGGGGGSVRRSESVSRGVAPVGGVLADAAPTTPGSRGGFFSKFKRSNAAHSGVIPGDNENGLERGRGLGRRNSASGSRSRSSSHSSVSTYYVLPRNGQKVEILRFDGTPMPANGLSQSGPRGSWLKSFTPKFLRSSSRQPAPRDRPPSHRGRASIDVPFMHHHNEKAPQVEPDVGVAFTSGGRSVAPTSPSVVSSHREARSHAPAPSEKSGRKLVRRGSEVPTMASAATSAGHAGIGAGGGMGVVAT